MARVNHCAHAGCGVRLILAKGPLGRRFPPLNAVTDPLGTVAAQHLVSGAWSARFLASGEEPVVPEYRYSVHACDGTRHAAQRAQVKAALADKAKAQRNQRGRRSRGNASPAGYVVQPPQLPGMGDR
jgi:hypothetical protein